MTGPAHPHKPRAIIIGSGVYGASLAHTLASLPSSHHSSSSSWRITILDRSETGYAATDAASYDLNKIIRSDYSDANFRNLGKEAIRLWRDPDSIWSTYYHETGVLFRSGYRDTVDSKGTPSRASAKDREYVQAGIKGALEAEEGEDAEDPHPENPRLPEKAYHLSSPSQAAEVFPSTCRELLGSGISTIGEQAANAGNAVEVKQDAYINPRGGWAEAADATHKTLDEARLLLGHEMQIVGDAMVIDLLFADSHSDKRRVIGVRIASGKEFILTKEEQADGLSCVVLCTGSWTRDLLDKVLEEERREGRNERLPMTPSAQCVVTIQLPSEMAQRYRGTPVSLDFSNGFYLFEPNKDDIMKIAIHSVGYQHPRPSRLSTTSQPTFAAGERPDLKTISTSSNGHAGARSAEQPDASAAPDLDHVAEPYIPQTKVVDMLDELASVYPEIASYAKRSLQEGRSDIVRSRVCHYCDSADENWIIDWVDGVEGLLTATGDSGHGYKFLPVIGRLIAARMGVKDVPPLTEHQQRVFSFAHHFNLANKPRTGADSNRFKPTAHA